ncbi:endonuclease III [Candidatus Pacearchaeota archaeon]|nr:endonuclease III [Candidatus Pacearchaeota archaeon]
MKTKKERISKIFKILGKFYEKSEKPTIRKTSEKNDPFKTLITCLLSLRTQDKNTAKTSTALFAVADTPDKIVKLPVKQLEKLIYSSGYYKNKARTIKHVSQVILEEHDGKVPESEYELLNIKGIGRKTANIVLSFAFKKEVIPVDTHVHVVSNRLGWAKTKNATQTELELMKVVPRAYWKELNTIFVLFGKEICITQSPLCSKCPVSKLCPRIGVKRSR